ncbi:hypothetical protein R3P38DRAFT_2783040 [Favolaschia claudopus]|uniref:Uncharacterized protein n=1 Tax=Favolaschia claudopus TaxID=2862362 RepID=A0AAW0B265_9AGAR
MQLKIADPEALENVRLAPKPEYDSQLSTDYLGYRLELKRSRRAIRLCHQRLSRRSPDIPDLVKHCVRSHTEYTRQHQSTDVKVGDNSTTRTLSFGKETADQAISRAMHGHSDLPAVVKEVTDDRVNGRTYSGVQHEGQQYITKYNSRGSTRSAYYGNGEFRAQFRATGPRIHGNPLPDFETAHSIERNPLPPCENVLKLSGIHCHPVKSRLKWVESTAPWQCLAILPGNPSTDSVEKVPKSMGIHCEAVKKPSQTGGIHCEVEKTRLEMPESTAKLTFALPNHRNPLRSWKSPTQMAGIHCATQKDLSQPTEQPNKEL